MRLHRFYLQQEIDDTRKLSIQEERLINQWKNVFRYKPGDSVLVFNGNGKEYEAKIEEINKKEIILQIVSEKEGIIPLQQITLYQSLIKKDNLEWIIEKTTELGISTMIPILSERSEKKGFNLERGRKIAIEASEQCGRGNIPILSEIISLKEALEQAQGVIFIFDTGATSLLNSFSVKEKGKREKREEISIFIGPEGGWSEKELELFKEKGAEIFSLGSFTLRAETAAIYSLAALRLLDL